MPSLQMSAVFASTSVVSSLPWPFQRLHKLLEILEAMQVLA